MDLSMMIRLAVAVGAGAVVGTGLLLWFLVDWLSTGAEPDHRVYAEGAAPVSGGLSPAGAAGGTTESCRRDPAAQQRRPPHWRRSRSWMRIRRRTVSARQSDGRARGRRAPHPLRPPSSPDHRLRHRWRDRADG